MAEQFANKIRTTLAAAYTAGSGTCTVTDATGMPATGDFRLRLGNVAGTILKVTARAGAVLTVTPEQDDGNASIGDLVRLVPTAGSMLALKADAIAGSGGGGLPWWPAITALDQSAWSNVNIGSVTVVQGGGIVWMHGPSDGTENLRGRVVNQPATPYTILALILPGPLGTGGFGGFGIGFSDGTKLVWISFGSNNGGTGPKISLRKNTNPTTNSANTTTPQLAFAVPAIWLKLTNNGATMTLEYSFDGVNFITMLSEALGTFLTPTQVGIFLQNFGTTVEAYGSIASWKAS